MAAQPATKPLYPGQVFTEAGAEALAASIRALTCPELQGQQPNNEKQGPGALNVALVGIPSAGKSTTINTWLSALSDRLVEVAIPLKMTAGQATRRFTNYQSKPLITNTKGTLALGVNFLDSPGIAQTQGPGLNYDAGSWSLLLEGNVSPGVPCPAQAALTQQDLPPVSDAIRAAQRPHVVVIVFPANQTPSLPAANAAPSAINAALKELVNKAVGTNTPICIILDYIDVVDPPVAVQVSAVNTSAEIRKRITAVADFFGVAPNRVLPMKNYTEEYDRVAEVNVLALLALKRIMCVGIDSIRMKKN